MERINLKYYLLQSRSCSCLLNVGETWRDLKTITQTRPEPESNPEAGDRCSPPGGCVLALLDNEYQNIHSISKMITFLRSEVKLEGRIGFRSGFGVKVRVRELANVVAPCDEPVSPKASKC